ncbi:MAG: dTDP-4-dehydrorhamnose 3,5-epimerase family protein [Elusimicrobiales bacterium]|nr:dTDP-4-dehydrorhamnose 3,5-epimerase family protein [Elusimicrobiales bacterium]
MNFVKKATPIAGCYEILPTIRKDSRGAFVKIFHEPEFRKLGLPTKFKETYYSVSKKGVLRGLHFQVPPAAISKLLYCVEGVIVDAVLDLRRRSKTYGKSAIVRLGARTANMLYIPEGCAHGFYAVSRRVVMLYHTTGVYSPEHDTGLLWNSARVKWPCKQPIISKRDASLPSFADFLTPF